jgi:hypothetical protein
MTSQVMLSCQCCTAPVESDDEVFCDFCLAHFDEESKRATIDDLIEIHKDPLEHFREMFAISFTAWSQGELSYNRKPPFSLRLIAAGDNPKAKLLVYPQWNPGSKTINPDTVVCELLYESERKGGFVWEIAMAILLQSGRRARNKSHYPLRVETDFFRLINVVTDFIDNAPMVIARNHSNCAICGKRLTDTTSRARGIGPECIVTKAPYFAFMDRVSIMQASPAR